MSLFSQRLPANPVALGGSWWAGLREYFAYHGVWAPGVRALRVLTIRAKVLLVMSILAAPLGPLSWQIVKEQNHAVFSNSQRLAGLNLASAASALRAEFGAPATALEAGVALPQDGRVRADHQLSQAYADSLEAGLPVQLEWERGRAAVERALQAPWNRMATSDIQQQALAALQQLRDKAVASAAIQATEDKAMQVSADLALTELPTLQVSLTLLRRAVHAWDAADGSVSAADRHAQLVRLAGAVAEAQRLATDVTLLLESPALALGVSQGGAPDALAAKSVTLAAVNHYLQRVRKQLLEYQPQGNVSELRQAYQAARSEVHSLRLQKLAFVGERLQLSKQEAETLRTQVFVALTVSILLAAYLTYCFFLVMRGGVVQIDRQMKRVAEGDLSARLNPLGVDEVATTMASMTVALVRLSDLLASVRQGVAAVKQASQQVAVGNHDLSQRNRDTAQGVASVLDGVSRSAEQLAACGRQVESVVALVQSLRLESARNRKQMQRLRERMGSLRTKSQDIGEIVRLIDNIAFRTNILALNASVEASKAGEAGRGFAVVAQEVRSLALRGADAARRIDAIVVRSTEDIELSGALAEETGQVLAQADEHVDQIHLAMDDVAALTREGEAESSRIVEQLSRIKDDTAQNLSQVQQLATASDSLRSQGERLSHKVAQFKLS